MTNLTITGTPRAGYTLTATVDPATAGTFSWTGAGVATGDTYVVDIADAGQSVAVTFTYPGGRNGRDLTEQAEINILPLEENNPLGDFFLRKTNVNDRRSFAIAENGTWENVMARDNFAASAKAYTWLRDGVAIPGETSETYAFTSEDQGSEIQLRIDYLGGLGNPKYVASRTEKV